VRTLLLLTKYNAAIPGLAGRPGLDPAWLDARLRLFRDWPLMAVRAQVRPPDPWLIFVDAETPLSDRDALGREVEGLAELVPVAGPLEDGRVRELVAERLGPEVRSLVTARLDSDDAIAAGYLARVWEAAEGWQGFVNAPLGYRICAGRLVRCRDRSGPFLSFVERLGRGLPRTVLQVPHHEAERRGPVLQLDGPPAWLQVVHGGNLANRFRGWPADAGRACRDLDLPGLGDRMRGDRLGLRELAAAAGGQLRSDLGGWMRRGPRSPGGSP
jgi:hypothetical protein